jgi:hypothetical protein
MDFKITRFIDLSKIGITKLSESLSKLVYINELFLNLRYF